MAVLPSKAKPLVIAVILSKAKDLIQYNFVRRHDDECVGMVVILRRRGRSSG